jgi:signal peptidase I
VPVLHPLVGRNPRATLLRIVIIISFAVIVFGWILVPLRLSGISMLPTYQDGALNFANRAAYWVREPARGDVVAIRLAGPHAFYVKRVIGMPGERVEIVAGAVRVNEEVLVEPTVVRRAAWNMAPVDLAAGEFFVVGDNRSMKIEHHDLGRVSRRRIVGKLLF